jgi:diguanylate cyclase (GGDEF)-like protein/PAS domain S-box-containing protein
MTWKWASLAASRRLLSAALRRPGGRYLTALVVFAVALGLRSVIPPSVGYVTLYPAAVLTALLCGAGPALVVVILGGATGYCASMDPIWSFKVDRAPLITLAVYVLSGGLICWMVHQARGLERRQSLLAAVVASSGDAIVSKTLDGIVTGWNAQAERLFGYAAAEAIGQPMTMMLPPDRVAEEAELLAHVADGGTISGHETVRLRKDGSAVNVSVTLSPIRDDLGRVAGAAKIIRDITDRKQIEWDLLQTARHDVLTGLPNRAMFHECLARAMARAARGNQHLALFFLDLDDFKTINESLGYAVGDQLLRAVAQRLLTSVRGGDLVCRHGGDEFAMVLESVRPGQVDGLAGQILRMLGLPFQVEDKTVRLAGSMGIAVYPDCGTDELTLIEKADAAMYDVKRGGVGGYRFCCQSGCAAVDCVHRAAAG